MRVSSFSGKAQVFKDGKWSAWMTVDEAKRIENEMYFGNAKGMRITLVARGRAANSPKSAN